MIKMKGKMKIKLENKVRKMIDCYKYYLLTRKERKDN